MRKLQIKSDKQIAHTYKNCRIDLLRDYLIKPRTELASARGFSLFLHTRRVGNIRKKNPPWHLPTCQSEEISAALALPLQEIYRSRMAEA
jgi:hypothetical protein